MRIEALTFPRFVAALIVVFFHYGRETSLAQACGLFLISGPQMVTFFFVLSGFVLMAAHYHKPDQPIRQFYVSRIARIVPVYLIALGLSAFFYYGWGNNNLKALLLSATFLQSWFPPYALVLNDPGWSLSVEIFFYITFPVILIFLRSGRIAEKHLVISMLLLYLITQATLSNLLLPKFYAGYPSISHDLIWYFPLSHYCSFLIGVTCGYIYVRNSDRFHNRGAIPMLLMIAAVALSVWGLQYPHLLERFFGCPLAFGASFYSLMFALVVLGLAWCDNIITRTISLPFFILLGNASYALYILQKPVHEAYSRYISSRVSMSTNTDFYVYMVILIGLSILSFYCVEAPTKKLVFKINSFIHPGKRN